MYFNRVGFHYTAYVFYMPKYIILRGCHRFYQVVKRVGLWYMKQ